MSRAVIRRSKLEWHHGQSAWLYSVSLDGARSVSVSTRLDSAVEWAQDRGATCVVKTWGHAITKAIQAKPPSTPEERKLSRARRWKKAGVTSATVNWMREEGL